MNYLKTNYVRLFLGSIVVIPGTISYCIENRKIKKEVVNPFLRNNIENFPSLLRNRDTIENFPTFFLRMYYDTLVSCEEKNNLKNYLVDYSDLFYKIKKEPIKRKYKNWPNTDEIISLIRRSDNDLNDKQRYIKYVCKMIYDFDEKYDLENIVKFYDTPFHNSLLKKNKYVDQVDQLDELYQLFKNQMFDNYILFNKGYYKLPIGDLDIDEDKLFFYQKYSRPFLFLMTYPIDQDVRHPMFSRTLAVSIAS